MRRDAMTAMLLILAAVALVCLCGCNGMPSAISLPYGIPPQISEEDVGGCKAAFATAGKTREAAILDRLWHEHGQNILTDCVHDGDTCPILYWYPRWRACQNAIASASTPEARAAAQLDYAKAMLKFLKNKHKAKQPHGCDCVRKLRDLGITDWE